MHFFGIATPKSGPHLVCFVHFHFRNVLRATTACNFSSLIWPASSAPATLASLLFDPPEPQIIGKTQCFATFLPFRASASSFFLLFPFYSSFFLSSSSLCLFPALLFICPYCRKFDFKLPSIIYMCIYIYICVYIYIYYVHIICLMFAPSLPRLSRQCWFHGVRMQSSTGGFVRAKCSR